MTTCRCQVSPSFMPHQGNKENWFKLVFYYYMIKKKLKRNELLTQINNIKVVGFWLCVCRDYYFKNIFQSNFVYMFTCDNAIMIFMYTFMEFISFWGMCVGFVRFNSLVFKLGFIENLVHRKETKNWYTTCIVLFVKCCKKNLKLYFLYDYSIIS